MKKVDEAEVLGNWWKTSIIDMEPGRIEFRGHPIQDLIGTVTVSYTHLTLPTTLQV